MSWSTEFISEISQPTIAPIYHVRQALLRDWGDSEWSASTNPAQNGAVSPIVDGSVRITGSQLQVGTWTSTGGTFRFAVPELKHILPYITRGHVLILSVGFPGWPLDRYNDVAIGVVSDVSGYRPAVVEMVDAMAVFRSRATKQANKQQLFYAVGATTTLREKYQAGDSTLKVETASGFGFDKVNGNGAVIVEADSGESFIAVFSSVTGSPASFDGVTGGALGTADDDAGKGNTVTELAFLPGHPADIYARILQTTGTADTSPGDNGNDDVYPGDWGLGVPERLVNRSDIDVWKNARNAIGGTRYQPYTAEPIDNGMSWLLGIFKRGGFFPVVRQGQFSLRAAVNPDAGTPDTGVHITDSDIEDGIGAISYSAWSGSQPAEYGRVSVTTGDGITGTGTTRTVIGSQYARLEYQVDLSSLVYNNTLNVRTEHEEALRLYAHRVGERIGLTCSGNRLSRLTVGDRVRFSTRRLQGRSPLHNGKDSFDYARALVTRVSPDLDRRRAGIELLVIPGYDSVLP